MSAPLVVNTLDGTVWTRRPEMRDGQSLYAPDKCGRCPEFVMATYADLEEHGIAGSADVLPVPVGPEPQMDADRAKAPWGRGEDGRPLLPMGAHWTDIPELVDREVAAIQTRVDEAQSGNWYKAPTTEMGLAPGTVCTRVDGYHRTVGQFTNVSDADLELVLHAHGDLSWCLEMIAKLRAMLEKRTGLLRAVQAMARQRGAEVKGRKAYGDRLKAENAELRARVAELEAQRQADHETWQHDLRTARDEHEATAVRIAGLEAERHSTNEALADVTVAQRAAESADRLTAFFAPVASLREDPHDSPLHHSYLVPHNLPETGGA